MRKELTVEREEQEGEGEEIREEREENKVVAGTGWAEGPIRFTRNHSMLG
jgi:hypothetical protein